LEFKSCYNPVTYNIRKERVLLLLIVGNGEATHQGIRLQVKDQDRIRCDLLGTAQDVGQASIENPQAIAYVHLNSEGGNDGGVVFQLNAGILSLLSIQTSARRCLLILGLHIDGQLVGLPTGIRVQFWRLLRRVEIDVVQGGSNTGLPSKMYKDNLIRKVK